METKLISLPHLIHTKKNYTTKSKNMTPKCQTLSTILLVSLKYHYKSKICTFLTHKSIIQHAFFTYKTLAFKRQHNHYQLLSLVMHLLKLNQKNNSVMCQSIKEASSVEEEDQQAAEAIVDEEEEEGSAMPIFPVKCVQLLSGTFCIIVTNKYFFCYLFVSLH